VVGKKRRGGPKENEKSKQALIGKGRIRRKRKNKKSPDSNFIAQLSVELPISKKKRTTRGAGKGNSSHKKKKKKNKESGLTLCAKISEGTATCQRGGRTAVCEVRGTN